MLDSQHKIFWDHDKLRYHMYTTGKFSSHLDAQLGFNFDDLEHLSIRQQRQVIKQRAKQMIKNQRLKFRFQHQGPPSPLSLDYSPAPIELKLQETNVPVKSYGSPKKSTEAHIQDGIKDIDSN